MYIVINYPYGEDLEVIEGADVIEWIDDNTVALEVDFGDLEIHHRVEESLEYHEAEGAVFTQTLYHVNLHHCKFGCHHVLNEDAIEEHLVKLYQEGAA